MNYKYNEIIKAIANGQKPFLFYPIERDEIESKSFKRLDDFFKTVTRVGKPLRHSCGITVSGYDDVKEELFEIEDLRKYVDKMFHRYPYLLYYINIDMGYYEWIISSWADQSIAVRGDQHIMNAYESSARYGSKPPQFPIQTSFDGLKFNKMLNTIRAHGVKIGDIEGANEVAGYYDRRFRR